MLHVIPLGDFRDHWCVEDCWCKPEMDECEDGPIMVHHAMDQRERYESGELRLH